MEVQSSDEHAAIAPRPAGDIDVDTAPELYGCFLDALSRHPTVLELDLSGVTFLDSIGLGTLVKMERELDFRGGTLRLLGVPARVHRVLELTRLDGFLLGDDGYA